MSKQLGIYILCKRALKEHTKTQLQSIHTCTNFTVQLNVVVNVNINVIFCYVSSQVNHC